jgi:hypothetical protein
MSTDKLKRWNNMLAAILIIVVIVMLVGKVPTERWAGEDLCGLLSLIKQGGLDYALNPSISSPDRGRCCSLAHQPIHPNGGLYQDDLECRRGHCHYLLAPERFWSSQFLSREGNTEGGGIIPVVKKTTDFIIEIVTK